MFKGYDTIEDGEKNSIRLHLLMKDFRQFSFCSVFYLSSKDEEDFMISW